jgi:hypothetical protein
MMTIRFRRGSRWHLPHLSRRMNIAQGSLRSVYSIVDSEVTFLLRSVGNQKQAQIILLIV